MTTIGFDSSDDSEDNEYNEDTSSTTNINTKYTKITKPHQISITHNNNHTNNIQQNQMNSNPSKRRKISSSITNQKTYASQKNFININIEKVKPSKYEWTEHPKIAIVSALVDFQPKITRFRLKTIANILPNIEYKPEEFVAVRVRLKYPRIMVTIFSNGRLTAQSGKSRVSCKIALRKIAKKLRDTCGYSDIDWQTAKLNYYGIHANARFLFNINLKEFAEHDMCADYMEDEQSFYLKYIHPKYSGICKIYHQGRIIVMGAQSVESSIQWLDDMHDVCQPYFTKYVEEECGKFGDQKIVGHFANRNRMNIGLESNSVYYGNRGEYGLDSFPYMQMEEDEEEDDLVIVSGGGPPPLIHCLKQ